MRDREQESIVWQAAANLPEQFCPDCGDKIINRGAHMERCYGPMAHGRCECPPGWKHRPACPEVVGYPDGAA